MNVKPAYQPALHLSLFLVSMGASEKHRDAMLVSQSTKACDTECQTSQWALAPYKECVLWMD